MDDDIIDWDARQKRLKKKVDEYDAAQAQNKVPEYMHKLRLDPTSDILEVLQAIVDSLIEKRRLLVVTGDAAGDAFTQIECQIATLQNMIDKEMRIAE
jgi:hypothetical protein